MYTLITEWHSLETAREEWVDAPSNDAVLEQLLSAAQDAVIAYAPASLGLSPESEMIPNRIAVAQLTQARNVWNAQRVSSQSTMGGDGDYSYVVHPLDWHVKQLIRPTRAVPVVG